MSTRLAPIAPLLALIAPLLFPAPGLAQYAYDRHVAFDTSLSVRAHHYTEGSVVAPSELELIDGRWPLETATCVTPPNCLRLSWRSGRGADWRMTLRLTRYYANIKPAGPMLSFSAYADTPLTHDASPLIQVTDERGVGSPTIRSWRRAPRCRRGNGSACACPSPPSPDCSRAPATPRSIRRGWRRIAFLQGLDDGVRHTLLIDESGSTTAKARRWSRPVRPGGADGARLRPARRPDLAAVPSTRPPPLPHPSIDRRRSVRAGRHPEGHARPLRRLRRCERPAGGLQDQRGRHRLSTNRRRRRPSAPPRARSATTSC